MLSNLSIASELNKNIFISPLKIKNIRGATVNLTASKYAWSLKTKQSIVHDNIITIPANDTALIVTEEILHVTSKIAGTYHSKVKLASKGLGHIGTTLDPTWFGHSLVAVHNVSNKDVNLDCNDTFVSLTFHYLDKPLKETTLDNHSGRTDVLSELGIQNIPTCIGEEGIGDLDVFKKNCKSDQEETIKTFLEPYEKPFYKNWNFWYIVIIFIVAFGIALFIYKTPAEQRNISDFIYPSAIGILAFFMGKLIK